MLLIVDNLNITCELKASTIFSLDAVIAGHFGVWTLTL